MLATNRVQVPELTRNQLAVLEYIHAANARLQSPTNEELAKHFGIARSSAHKVIEALTSKGLIFPRMNEHRSLKINYRNARAVLFLAEANRLMGEILDGGEVNRTARHLSAAFACWCKSAMCVTPTEQSN